MEKRLLLALFLSLLVLVGYPYLMQKLYGPPLSPLPAPPPLVKEGPLKESASESISSIRKTVLFETEQVRYIIDEERASISEIVLKNYFVSGHNQMKLAEVENATQNIAYFWLDNPKLYQVLWNKVEENTHSLSFSAKADPLELKKGFFRGMTDFDLMITIEVTNSSSFPTPLYFGLVGPSSYVQVEEDSHFFKVAAFTGGKAKVYKSTHLQRSPIDRKEEAAAWFLLQGKYFSQIVKSEKVEGGHIARVAEKSGDPYLAFLSQPLVLQPGESVKRTFLLYSGPNALSELSKLGKWAEGTLYFGFLGGIAKLILKGLLLLKQLTGSYGVAIICTTVLITIFFLPLSLKSYNSMSKMKLLQPEMMKLRELYKDKPKKLNKEVMALYKRHKVNPLGGCLPLLFQMPIFIALYQVLARSFELKGSSFLFIKDLSIPDRVIPLPVSIWPIGDAINLLPLLMMAAMLMQQKLSQPLAAGAPEDETQRAMKLMPILFGFLFYGLPSGLVLYWLTNTLLSIGTQRIFVRA